MPTTHSWCEPRSTKSPLKTMLRSDFSEGMPNAWKSSNTSRSCPWMSPNTLQGAVVWAMTGCDATILPAALEINIRVSVTCSLPKSFFSRSVSNHSESNSSTVAFPTSLTSFSTCLMTCRARCFTERSTVTAVFALLFVPAACVTFLMSMTRACMIFPQSTPHIAMSSWLLRVVVALPHFFGGALTASPRSEARDCPETHLETGSDAFDVTSSSSTKSSDVPLATSSADWATGVLDDPPPGAVGEECSCDEMAISRLCTRCDPTFLRRMRFTAGS
mmetsp:Transcript_95553/g.247045  ORF Transcript_95553/g.247045 Transcript_95553/m.247045 type:complete len:275 (+) Transcript_95553:766-1590(+)